MKKAIALILFATGSAYANGTLTQDMRISSEILGYDVQYRVYLPQDYESSDALPVLFLTDGPGYISRGRVPQVLDKLISSSRIKPVVAVFVDPRDPENPKINRRNEQFLCNRDYLDFYVSEFIPAIENDYAVGRHRDKRSVMGLSFGATNAACFAILGHDWFSGIGMQSPANHPLPTLLPAFEASPKLPLRMFLSTGNPDDNTRANRKFRNVLRNKGYDLKYVEVRKGHDWDNWRPLVDDVLLYFYGADDQLSER